MNCSKICTRNLGHVACWPKNLEAWVGGFNLLVPFAFRKSPPGWNFFAVEARIVMNLLLADSSAIQAEAFHVSGTVGPEPRVWAVAGVCLRAGWKWGRWWHLFYFLKSLSSKSQSPGIRVFTPNDLSQEFFLNIQVPFGGRKHRGISHVFLLHHCRWIPFWGLRSLW